MITWLIENRRILKSFTLKEIKGMVNTVIPDLEAMELYKTKIKDWLSPVINLKEFNVYPTNGITEGLNYWMAFEKRKIYMNEGDYIWLPNNREGEIFYMSSPSSIDGNYKKVPTDIPVALDLAYIGSAKPQKIEIGPNVELVFFSLSKCFGLKNIRTGWLFSRKSIPRLEALTLKYRYYNYYAHQVAEKIIDNFKIDYIYNKLKYNQIEVCKEMNLEPSDVMWIATTNNSEWNDYKRANKNRICISKELYEYRHR